MRGIFKDLRTIWVLVPERPWRWMTLATVGSLAMALLDMIGVAAMLPLMQAITGTEPSSGPLLWISNLIGSTDPARLTLTAAAGVGIAFVLKSVSTIGFRWWLLGKTARLEAVAAGELVSAYGRSSMLAHRQRDLAKVNRNIGVSILQTFSQVVLGLLSIVAEILTLAAIGIVLVVVSPLVALLGLVFFGAVGWGMQRILRRRQQQVGTDVAEAELSSWRSLMPLMNGFREIRLAGATDQFVHRFREARLERASAQRRRSLLGELPKYVLEVGLVVAIGGVAALLFATSDTTSALAVLGVFAAGSTRLLPSLNRLLASAAMVRTGRAGLTQLALEVDTLAADTEHPNQPPRRRFSGDITAEGIGFHFPDSEVEVLSGVDLTIAAGQTTAVVGPSGAGKSTLLDILLGLLPPSTGQVRCGGDPITEDLAGWCAGIGVVPQDVFLLDDTLEANICFTEETVDPLRRDRAIALAQLDELVAGLPHGLATRMGERGVRLSGGQRQRVGIARALYREPSVLVLDEATSALDNVTEQKITQTITGLRGQVTILVVAHRLSTVRHADQIVFLSDGEVRARGTFAEVEASSPDFAHLVALGKL